MPRLHRVKNMPQKFRMIPYYARLYLNISEYSGIWVNMPKSFRMAIVLHYLCGYITLHMVTYLNVSGSLKVIV